MSTASEKYKAWRDRTWDLNLPQSSYKGFKMKYDFSKLEAEIVLDFCVVVEEAVFDTKFEDRPAPRSERYDGNETVLAVVAKTLIKASVTRDAVLNDLDDHDKQAAQDMLAAAKKYMLANADLIQEVHDLRLAAIAAIHQERQEKDYPFYMNSEMESLED